MASQTSPPKPWESASPASSSFPLNREPQNNATANGPDLPPRDTAIGYRSYGSSYGGYGSSHSPYSSLGSTYGGYGGGYGGYGSSYSPYSSLGGYGSPYSRYGGGYGGYGGYSGYGTTYGSYGSGYGNYGNSYSGYGGVYGGRYGNLGGGGTTQLCFPLSHLTDPRLGPPGAKPPGWIDNGFRAVDGLHMVTDNFGRFAGLLNANAEAVGGAFSSVIGLLEMGGHLGREVGGIVSGFVAFRALRRLFLWLFGRADKQSDSALDGDSLAAKFNRKKKKKKLLHRTGWANTLAFLALTFIGGPMVIALLIKFFRILSGRDGPDGPILVARALHDFPGTTPQDLNFMRGDVVHVLAQPSPHWWEGEVQTGQYQGMRGMFPFNYVELQGPLMEAGNEGEAGPEQPRNQALVSPNPMRGGIRPRGPPNPQVEEVIDHTQL